MSLNRKDFTAGKGLLLLLAWFATIVSGCTATQPPYLQNNQANAPETQDQSTQTTITEGRSAVEFYRDEALADDEALRLSDEFVQYPVDPVERLLPVFELGDPFLGNGPIRPGIKTPFGQMLQPSLLVYGAFRSAFQSFESDGNNAIEWANRLDLNVNLNLSGTERLVVSMRPLDSETGRYTGYNFHPKKDDGGEEGFNARLTRLYFEGEIGEIFPGLDPTDSGTYDVSFSVGRQDLIAQDGILVNDIIDMVGITRNSLIFDGVSNLRATGVYGWNHISRGNNSVGRNTVGYSAQLFGLLLEADTALDNTLALDVFYVDDNLASNAWYIGAAATQRLGKLNTTFRVNASIPDHDDLPAVGGGVLLLSQLSSTLPSSDNVVYLNTFWNIDQFTSAARRPDQGNPLANLGILYGPVGMGRYGEPLGQPIQDTVGTALGYQMFFDGIDSQLILELGARTSTKSGRNEGVLGFGARYQKAIGKHHILRLDSFVAGEEGVGVSYGLRTEWVIKF